VVLDALAGFPCIVATIGVAVTCDASLADLGHRGLLYCASRRSNHSSARVEGYRLRWSKQDSCQDDPLLWLATLDMLPAKRLPSSCLKLHDRPTAVGGAPMNHSHRALKAFNDVAYLFRGYFSGRI